MANLVAVNIKRKEAEVAVHGFSMFLDPKRIKLQNEAEIPEMMEEEESFADTDAGAAPVVLQVQQPTMFMPSPSPLQPTQGQGEAAVLHDSTVSTESGSRSSEPVLAAEQAAPMDIEEEDIRQPQPQPGQHPHFWSGFF